MDHTITNLLRIKEEINLKDSHNTKIIAVTKTFPADKILSLLKFGHVDFGENKVQEATLKWSKIKEDYKNIKLHMIGKLQTNKVKYVVPLFDYIHSLDSLKLAEKIAEHQIKFKKKLSIFIQVNIGNEEQKNGIEIENLDSFYLKCTTQFDLKIIGLMCLPPANNSATYFSKIRDLNNNLKLKELSMGMSNDYLEACEYKSTFLRIGSKIFGKRT